MRPRSALWPLALSAVLLSAAGCGGSGDPVRIGIITDCSNTGVFAQSEEPSIAGAELPLIQRGARMAGAAPSQGVEGASVGGRPVKLEIACAEQLNSKSALFQLRRLVDSRHVAAVVGPTHELDQIEARYARMRPGVTFMLASYDQSSTLRFAAPNMFRFELDSAQISAGLAGYAYHRLGWRNMTTVGEDDAPGWTSAAGFDAEFCALGGHVRRLWAPGAAGGDKHWLRRVSSATDGVFLAPGSAPLYKTLDFVSRWARHHDPSRRVAVGWDADPTDSRLSGVVAVSSWSWAKKSALHRWKRRFAKTFGITDYVDAMAYYDEVEPLIEAVEKVHGDTSKGQQLLQHALANLQYHSPLGPIHLDGRNQAIGPTYLGRIGDGTVRQIATVRGVEQTFGGYFGPHSTPPGPHSPACVKRPPPPWVVRRTR
jgi:branched-chain amino acid transport system substrate-binding protein